MGFHGGLSSWIVVEWNEGATSAVGAEDTLGAEERGTSSNSTSESESISLSSWVELVDMLKSVVLCGEVRGSGVVKEPHEE